APDRLLVVIPLDGDGNNIRDRLEKVDILLSEITLRRAIGAEKTERTSAARNNHRDAADDSVVEQQLRWLERQFLTQVVDNQPALALESVAGLRIGVGRDRRRADVTLLPAHSGAQQKRLAARHQFEKVAVADPQAFPYQRERRVEKRRKL